MNKKKVLSLNCFIQKILIQYLCKKKATFTFEGSSFLLSKNNEEITPLHSILNRL